jgi:hypothetical protein
MMHGQTQIRYLKLFTCCNVEKYRGAKQATDDNMAHARYVLDS